MQDNASDKDKESKQATAGIDEDQDYRIPNVHIGSIRLTGAAMPNRSTFLYPDASIVIPATPDFNVSVSGFQPFSGQLLLGQQQLEDQIAELRRDQRNLLARLSEKTHSEQEKQATIETLRGKLKQESEKQRLQYILERVNGAAKELLLASPEFRAKFEETDSCFAITMSLDIRRSTELMLKARRAEEYARFVTELCAKLSDIILRNFGVLDKFTGDGILAFFPDFYSGEDAAYLAVKAADECHQCFSQHYEQNRHCFNSVLMDIGLGIGIDCGQVRLVKVAAGLSVIGTPVVFACRMSAAKAGQTLLNEPAYEQVSLKFGSWVNLQETEIEVKHEGRTLAYAATLSKKPHEPKLPSWAGGEYPETSANK